MNPDFSVGDLFRVAKVLIGFIDYAIINSRIIVAGIIHIILIADKKNRIDGVDPVRVSILRILDHSL